MPRRGDGGTRRLGGKWLTRRGQTDAARVGECPGTGPQARPLADPAIRDRYAAIANDAGLPANRLELVGHVKDLAAHLAL